MTSNTNGLTDLERLGDNTDGLVRRNVGDTEAERQQDDTNPATHYNDPSFNDLDDLDFQPTPFNPKKLEKCRIENIGLLAAIIIAIIFCIASLTTPVLIYRSKDKAMENVKIDIFIFQFDSDVEGVKNRYIIVEALCEEYLTRIIGYLVCQVLAVFFAVVNLIFTIPLVLGRACCSKYISFMLVLVNTVLLLIALSLGASVYNEKVCRGASLKYVGFSYGPSFALCVTNFCLGVVTLILYVVRRCMKPVRYMH